MTKKMRELQAKILEKTNAAKALTEGEAKDLAKAELLLNEVDELQKEYDIEARLEKAGKAQAETADPVQPEPDKTGEVDSVKAFADAARSGFKSMNEGTPADGGYTVPEDIVTKIQHFRSAKASLLDLVTVVPVKTNKGARTFKARAQQTGFTKVGEGAKIGAKGTPQYTRISYEIDKYAGYFPVTNELLADSDANIVSEIVTWIGDESRVTANKLILEQLNAKSSTPIATLKDIKKILNVTLGSAFKSTSVIVTNDDGLNWLDTLEDKDGNFLLQPNPADPMKLQLCAGSTVVPVKVYPNSEMPTTEAGIPVYIGDIKEAIVYWDRQQMTIKTSDTAVVGELNAYEEDLTLFRAIEREDVTQRDADAFVHGRIAVTA